VSYDRAWAGWRDASWRVFTARGKGKGWLAVLEKKAQTKSILNRGGTRRKKGFRRGKAKPKVTDGKGNPEKITNREKKKGDEPPHGHHRKGRKNPCRKNLKCKLASKRGPSRPSVPKGGSHGQVGQGEERSSERRLRVSWAGLCEIIKEK